MIQHPRRGKAEQGRLVRSTAALVGAVVFVVTLVSCRGEIPTEDFSALNREGFLTACVRPLDDPRLVSDVCRCVFDRAEGELGYERFAELDEQLRLDPSSGLPEDFVEIVADCFLDASGLNDAE